MRTCIDIPRAFLATSSEDTIFKELCAVIHAVVDSDFIIPDGEVCLSALLLTVRIYLEATICWM